MALATGVAKQLRYKKEVTWGTAPAASGAQLLRRVTSDLNMVKDTYESNEIRSDYQVADFRHGLRRVDGSINGELSASTYADFFSAALRKAPVTGATTGAQITISATAPNTVARSGGNFLTDGFKVGDVVRFTGFTGGATSNNNKNYVITSVSAFTLTVDPTVVTLAAGPSITMTAIGKKTFAAVTGHTDDSFSIEHWFGDIAQSELFTGCKVASIDVDLPATGMSTIAVRFLGKDVTTGVAQYYTSPTAETGTGVMTAVGGQVYVNASKISTLTGMRFTIDGGLQPSNVIGSNSQAAVFPGRIRVSGEFSGYFEDGVERDYFINETEISLAVQMYDSTAANAGFVAFTFPRVKVGGSSKNDGETGIIQTFPFTALLETTGGTGIADEKTTISYQDSAI